MLDIDKYYKNPKVSVIVPVYNSENYLEECLDSIINQSLNDIEIICVNDGSTDGSLEILKEYSKRDARIIILDEINQGAGFSRKKGITVSKGEYIYFADSDDILEPNLCELTYENGVKNESDIIFFKVNYFNTRTNYQYIPDKFDLSNFFAESIDFNNFTFNWKSIKPVVFNQFTNIWNCLFKGDFLRKNNICFPKKLSFNDVPLHVQSLILADKISFVPEVLYNYRLFNENSITAQSHNNRKIFDFFKIVDFLEKFLDDEKLSSVFRQDLIEFKLIQYNYHLSKLSDKSLCEEFFEEVKSELTSFEISDYEVDILSDDLKNIYGSFMESSDYMDLNLKMGYSESYADNSKSKIKVSIVIPVYNVESYLETCLGTVVNQSLEDIEIICVNDGATDNSLEILERYAKKDKRIKIITQKNCGLGCARNTGLKYVTGEYIFFLDSDDKILLDALEQLYNNASSNDSDIVLFKIARFDEESVYYSNPGFPLDKFFRDVDFNKFTFTYANFKNYVLNASFSAWSKLYKKEFLDSCDDFLFPVGTAYEDVLFHAKCLLRAKRISFVPEYFYMYRISNSSSIMHNKSNFFDIFNICDSVEEFLINFNYMDEFNLEFIRFKLTQLSQYILLADSQKYYSLVQNEFRQLDFDERYIAPNLIDAYNNILNYNQYDDYKLNHEKSTSNVSTPISIIIPINVENYVFECFDSLKRQSFENFEIICVVENSSNILKDIINYSRDDYRFKIYSKEFYDVNEARNLGLNYAKGEFVYFMNPTDLLKEDALENFYNISKKNNLDMLLFPVINFDNDSGEKFTVDNYDFANLPIEFDNRIFNHNDVSNLLFDLNMFYCNKFIRNDIYIKSNFKFYENSMFSEIPFFFKLFLNCERIFIIREYYYYKRDLINSSLNSKRGNFNDIMGIMCDIFKLFKEKHLFDQYKIKLTKFIIEKILYYYNYSDLSYKSHYFHEMKRIFHRISENNDLFNSFKGDSDENLLINFEDVLITNSFREFDLMVKLHEKEKIINELKLELKNYNQLDETL